MHNNQVALVQLGRNGLRDGDDALGEMEGQEALDGQRHRRLDDDLTGVPDVGLSGGPGGGPPVPAVQRVAVHDIGLHVRGRAARAGPRSRGQAKA